MIRDSEAASERPRGRPPAFDYDHDPFAFFLKKFPRVRTRRGQQDLCYRIRAVAALDLDFDERAISRAEPRFWKTGRALAPGILTALGRIKAKDLMWECYRWFVRQRRPRTVREGEQMVRWWRREKAKWLRQRGVAVDDVRRVI